MIAKRIVREKGASDFERLGAYVLNARGGVDPASWSRLGAYVLDEAHQGEKVAWARVTNCESEDPGWAVKEILASQARNTRGQADKAITWLWLRSLSGEGVHHDSGTTARPWSQNHVLVNHYDQAIAGPDLHSIWERRSPGPIFRKWWNSPSARMR
jgi:hypothetical protein